MADSQDIKQAKQAAKDAQAQAVQSRKAADKLKKDMAKAQTKGDPTKASAAELITGDY